MISLWYYWFHVILKPCVSWYVNLYYSSLSRLLQTFHIHIIFQLNQSLWFFYFISDVLRFVALPEDVRIRPGVSYVFNCVARGNPPPVVTWQRSGVELDAPLNIMPNNSLVINSARIEDSGFYACVAENDRGKIMKDFMVMVVGKWI